MTTSGPTVRIYRPARNAMQSGRGNTTRWLLEYDPAEGQEADGLMGWAGSGDTNRQLKLWFATSEEAVAFAQKKGLAYRVEAPHERTVKVRAYADNFAFTRIR
ncbi:MAG: ETC complex I subunit [Rhodospirillaceae bacterium]